MILKKPRMDKQHIARLLVFGNTHYDNTPYPLIYSASLVILIAVVGIWQRMIICREFEYYD